MITPRPDTLPGRVLRLLVAYPGRLFRIPITRQAHPTPTRLAVVHAYGASGTVHELAVPRGACPVSGNPISGTLRVEYAAAVSVEVVTLHDALLWACSGAPGAPRSAEALARWVATEVSNAVEAPVVVVLDLVIRPGRQRLVITHRTSA